MGRSVRTLERLYRDEELAVFQTMSLHDPNFKWKTKNNQFLLPRKMETRHLFYTLRMIWNHTMPEQARLNPYRHYRFGDFYSIEYIQKAIINIGRELLGRDDLTPRQESDLRKMAQFLQGGYCQPIGNPVLEGLIGLLGYSNRHE